MLKAHALPDVPRLTLVLGHAASGKSALAEREALAAAEGGRPTYLATARALDDETRAKVAAHAARRGENWETVEVPLALDAACARARGVVLIDCATMWLANAMLDGHDWEAMLRPWVAAMRTNDHARFWVVSNDVGGGVVPDNALARRFQRAQGLTNQRLAEAADRVALVTAGLAQWLK